MSPPHPLKIDKARYEEILAAAMLLGEPRPLICSLCLGAGQTKAIIGVRRCVQCGGTKFDYIGPETSRYAKLERTDRHAKLDWYADQVQERLKESLIESLLISWITEDTYMRKYTIGYWVMTWVGRWIATISTTLVLWAWVIGRF